MASQGALYQPVVSQGALVLTDQPAVSQGALVLTDPPAVSQGAVMRGFQVGEKHMGRSLLSWQRVQLSKTGCRAGP